MKLEEMELLCSTINSYRYNRLDFMNEPEWNRRLFKGKGICSDFKKRYEEHIRKKKDQEKKKKDDEKKQKEQSAKVKELENKLLKLQKQPTHKDNKFNLKDNKFNNLKDNKSSNLKDKINLKYNKCNNASTAPGPPSNLK